MHRSLYDRFVEGVADVMSRVRIGPTADPDTDLGPVISMAHRDKIAGMVDRARDYARVVTGGTVPGGELATGSYYAPTLIADADKSSEVVKDEIFGPVLCASPSTPTTKRITLANDTRYGLAASAWTRSVYRANRASREIRAGTVWINDHIPIFSEMPHGGMKESGFGKDMSSYSFEDYTVVKHVVYDLTEVAAKPWHRTIFTDTGR